LIPEDARGEPSVAIGDFQSGADEDAAAREREESKRLLYVAITRARDRLYFSTVLQDGRLRPARGSLAEVMPSSLVAALESAANGGGVATWSGPSAMHRIAVRREIDVAPAADAAGDRVRAAADLSAVGDEDPLPRLTVTGSRAEADQLSEPWEHEPVAGRPEARLAGTLVHRALEHAGRLHEDSDETLARRLASLVRDSDRIDGETGSAAMALGVNVLRRMLARPVLRGLLAAGEWLHELPFSWRGTAADGRRIIVRGTIDTVVRLRDGQHVVIEFKTGRRMPEHGAQLAVYLDAARAMFPDAPVHGLLVYPDEDVWSSSAPPVTA
jgi:ATP-dependent helicase/nuclease subunit A